MPQEESIYTYNIIYAKTLSQILKGIKCQKILWKIIMKYDQNHRGFRIFSQSL